MLLVKYKKKLTHNLNQIRSLDDLTYFQKKYRYVFLLYLSNGDYEEFERLDKEFDFEHTKGIFEFFLEKNDLPIYYKIYNLFCYLYDDIKKIGKINIIKVLDIEDFEVLRKLNIRIIVKPYSKYELKRLISKVFSYYIPIDMNKKTYIKEKDIKEYEIKNLFEKLEKIGKKYKLFK